MGTQLTGTWRFTQKWGTSPAYNFNAEFYSNGTIKITSGGGFFGTYAVLGTSNQIALAIADVKGQSITAYVGNIVGNVMGGQAEGAAQGKPGNAGVWSAMQLADTEAESKDFHVPDAG